MAIEKTSNGRYRARLSFRAHRATKTFDVKDDAHQWELDQKRLIRSDQFASVDSIDHTSSTIAKAFLDSYDYSDRAHVARLGYWKDIFTHRDLPLHNLKRDHFKDAQAHLTDKGLAVSTIHKYFSAWKTIFGAALDNPRIKLGDLSQDPSSSIKLPKIDNARDRYLSDDEYVRLIAAATQQPWTKHRLAKEPWECWPLVIELALRTGARAGNITAMKWSYIDFDTSTIFFPGHEQKNGDSYRRSLPSDLAAKLKAWRLKQRPCSYVFAERNSTQDRPHTEYGWYWRQSCKEAGLENCRFHDLRHTHASMLQKQGVPLESIRLALNHRCDTMTRRYCNANDEVRDTIPDVEMPASKAE
jgi:integrase